jgi:hypothetical protein
MGHAAPLASTAGSFRRSITSSNKVCSQALHQEIMEPISVTCCAVRPGSGDKSMPDKASPLDETYSEEETVARREAALKNMLSTPHKPQEKIGKRPERRVFKKSTVR